MSLTEKERIILQMESQGLSDYKIARRMNSDPPSITRSRQNAHKKLKQFQSDLQFAQQLGIRVN
jgi:DNA-binding CsgD family transcriptional regulator